jgi:NAD-dependent histone deacetylase SIR2
VVVAGAGISVSAGIPDFRSSTGLFKTLKREHNLKSSGKDLFDAAVYKDGDSTTSFHAMIRNLATATKTAEPTPFHHLLATLAQEGRLLRLYTQNVDGIDTSLPPLASQTPLPKKGPWPKTVQLHGTLEHMTCTKCHRISEFDPALFDGPSPPPCGHCEETDGIRTQHAGKRSHGIGVLRPRMVLYNEHNPDDEAIGSVVKSDLRTRPDALIVVGTTLKVPGVKRIVKEMCGTVRDRKDGVTVWINNDPPPALKDYDWDLVVQGPCDAVAARAAMRKWDQPEPELCLVTEEAVEKVKRENGVPQVVIAASPGKKNKGVEMVKGALLTPAASPKMKALSAVNITAPTTSAAAAKMVGTKKQAMLGAKRKAGEVTKATKAAPKKPSAPKKKTAPTAKKPSIKQPSGIKVSFKVGKPNTASTTSKQAPPPQKQQQEDVYTVRFSPKYEINDTMHDVVHVMQPVSPSSARTNGSPPYSAPTSLPKMSGGRKGYTGLSVDTQATTPVRRESAEERRRVVTPPGAIPKGMGGLLIMDSDE